jgi:hypothetical protein
MPEPSEWKAVVYENGLLVASVHGRDRDRVEVEGWHYLVQYAQDGGECRLEIKEVKPRRRRG